MERLTDRGFRFDAWREAPKERKDVPSVEDVYLRLQELENMIEDGRLVERRPKGEWVNILPLHPSDVAKKCNLCGHVTDTWRHRDCCPDCGAYMVNCGVELREDIRGEKQ